MRKLDRLKIKLDEINVIYVPIEDKGSINKIYDLFINDIKFEPTNGIECCYLGIYFRYIKKDNENTEKYYIMGVEYDNSTAMCNLAHYYNRVKGENDLAEKYYLRALRHGCIYSPLKIAIFYQNLRNYVKAEKYYLFALSQKNNVNASYYLALFYFKIMNDEINGLRYLEMAIECGHIKLIDNLICYYEKKKDYVNVDNLFILLITHDYNEIISLENFYLMKHCQPIKLLKLYIRNKDKIKRNDILRIIKYIFKIKLNMKQHNSFIKILSQFEFFSSDKLPKLLRTLTNLLKYNMDIMRLHFDYTVLGKGYDEAKKDFLDKIKNE